MVSIIKRIHEIPDLKLECTVHKVLSIDQVVPRIVFLGNCTFSRCLITSCLTCELHDSKLEDSMLNMPIYVYWQEIHCHLTPP